MTTGPGGAVSAEDGLALVGESALVAAASPARSRHGRALATLLEEISAPEAVRALALEQVKSLQTDGDGDRPSICRTSASSLAGRIGGGVEDPVRISFWDDGRALRVAAIHQAATVPERLVRLDRSLIHGAGRENDRPTSGRGRRAMRAHATPRAPDFRDVLHSGPLVFEVDRWTAPIHWEFLSSPPSKAPAASRSPCSFPLHAS